MPTEVWRPGDFRVCPKCRARRKVQDIKCSHCGTVLVGAPVQHATGAAVATGRTVRASGTLRALLVVGVLIAAGAGLWVRSLFRGAAVQDGVQAAEIPSTTPAPQPTWTPPVLSYPPMVGYNSGTPSGAATLAMRGAQEAPSDSAGQGMTSIAPPSEPTRKTAFTNEDLEHGRGATGAPAAATAVATSAAGVAARAVDSTEDATREWLSRVRDDEDKVRDAQAKVRRLQAQAEVQRAQAAGVSDPDAQARAQRDLADTLDDLDKAERKLAEKQRDLDDTKDKARSAGARL